MICIPAIIVCKWGATNDGTLSCNHSVSIFCYITFTLPDVYFINEIGDHVLFNNYYNQLKFTKNCFNGLKPISVIRFRYGDGNGVYQLTYYVLNHWNRFLAATKQLYKWYFPSVRLSVCPSVCLSHLFDYVPIIGSSWNFQELLPMTKVRSMQKVKVRGQRSRSQRSQPNLTVSGL